MDLNALTAARLPIRPLKVQRVLQSGGGFSVRTKTMPYSEGRDLSIYLKNKYPDEYVKQVELKNISPVETKTKTKRKAKK